MLHRWTVVVIGVAAIVALLLAACASGPAQGSPSSNEHAGGQVAEVNSDASPASEDALGTGDADHREGDEHAADEHAADGDHHEGDEHAADEHMADADHHEGDEHTEASHMEGDHDEGHEHGVPEEAAAMVNPIPATEESIAAGAAIYSQYCAVCHGPEGRGDGPGGAALEPKPADLHADHVQVLTDGGLFWFITNGAEGTGMPAWESVLSEEQRWQLVNYLRTFQEE